MNRYFSSCFYVHGRVQEFPSPLSSLSGILLFHSICNAKSKSGFNEQKTNYFCDVTLKKNLEATKKRLDAMKPIKIKKIDPEAFKRAGYLNTGDSMMLKVMVAAYDSTEVPIIKYDDGGIKKKK
ncbi:MAG TPA: hypothetical protein VD905_03605 [Flavobacteriales bacterium]|nr:hypothetical protein [Flavobacteriales bacterium]